MQIALFS